MKLQVEQAKEHIGTAFPWSRHDITINGEFWFDGLNFVTEGKIRSEGDYECARCLVPVHHVRTDSYHEVYSVPQKGDNVEDLEFLPFDGETIDLRDLIRETLIINEPAQVLCQEDCKGLCVHCGANLNTSPCSCDSFVVDPRFAALRALLDESDD